MIYQRIIAPAPRVTFGGAIPKRNGSRRRHLPVPLYHSGSANRCPSCGATSFDVRRVTAECTGCGEVLTIVTQHRSPPLAIVADSDVTGKGGE